MSKGETWTTIESDPGVFTQLVELMGVEGVQFEELYSLDKESLEALRPVYGLIFLFKWNGENDTRPIAEDTTGRVFFANQVINNACATQAILAVLLNSPQLKLGTELSQLRDFTADFPADLKGLSISNSDSIRSAHNSFARPEPIVSDESASASKDDEAYHFISYVPVDGTLYELDGLKGGPIALGSCADSDWLEKACPAIQERIERYAASEIRFNLMAVCRDRRQTIAEKLAEAEAQRACVMAALADTLAGAEPMQGAAGDTSASDAVTSGLPSDPATLRSTLAQLEDELARLQGQMQVEQQRRQEWRDENLRRKHNYIPLIFNLIKLMAEKHQLKPLIEQARAQPVAPGR